MLLFSETSTNLMDGHMPDNSTSSPEDFHANPTAMPENAQETTTIVRSGLKCLESLQKLNRPGLLVKMLLASSRWTAGVYSQQYYLTWKMRGIARKYILFRLSASAHRTSGNEYGLLPTATTSNGTGAGEHGEGGINLQTKIAGLLPTATAGTATYQHSHRSDGSKVKTMTIPGKISLLPTPLGGDATGGRTTKGKNRQAETGLRQIVSAILPTPVRGDADKHTMTTTYAAGNPTLTNQVGQSTGLKLQPAFVEWMMGYPPGWTELEIYPPRQSKKRMAKPTD